MPRKLGSQWEDVARWDVVEVKANGTLVQKGVVDERSSDGAFVWLVDSIGERKLLHKHDGYQLVKIG